MRKEIPLPETLKFNMQPYGTVTLGNLKLVPNDRVPAMFDLVGDVIDGTETSHLAGYRSTKKATGTRRIYGIEEYEITQGTHGDGVIVRIAM